MRYKWSVKKDFYSGFVCMHSSKFVHMNSEIERERMCVCACVCSGCCISAMQTERQGPDANMMLADLPVQSKHSRSFEPKKQHSFEWR